MKNKNEKREAGLDEASLGGILPRDNKAEAGADCISSTSSSVLPP